VALESDSAALSARISDAERVGRALAELARSDVAVSEFALGQPTLDEVFLALTGRPPADHATEEEAA
jgi:ABC-2 type transport system ATP-binding protein